MAATATRLDKERYERLKAAYDQLVSELTELEREGRVLRHRLQDIVDKQKMKEILEEIVGNKGLQIK